MYNSVYSFGFVVCGPAKPLRSTDDLSTVMLSAASRSASFASSHDFVLAMRTANLNLSTCKLYFQPREVKFVVHGKTSKVYIYIYIYINIYQAAEACHGW